MMAYRRFNLQCFQWFKGRILPSILPAVAAWVLFAVVAGTVGAAIAIVGGTWCPFFGFQAGGLVCLALMIWSSTR